MMEKRLMHELPSRPRCFGWVAVLTLLGGFGLCMWGIAGVSQSV
jgi:hypothetical protein